MAIGRQDIKQLEEILKKGKMNNNTRTAVKEIIKAIKKGDYDLAFELSAVKSVLSGAMDNEHYFREDNDYNVDVFGHSIYFFLDILHHNVPSGGRMPSGMMAFTSSGYYHEGSPSQRKHPIITLIEKAKKKSEEGLPWNK